MSLLADMLMAASSLFAIIVRMFDALKSQQGTKF